MDLPLPGEEFEIEYYVENSTHNINQIWITYFVIIEADGEGHEIHTSGFPVSNNKNFEIPQQDFLGTNNLPWGLEVEAEEFFITKERALFLDAFP